MKLTRRSFAKGIAGIFAGAATFLGYEAKAKAIGPPASKGISKDQPPGFGMKPPQGGCFIKAQIHHHGNSELWFDWISCETKRPA